MKQRRSTEDYLKTIYLLSKRGEVHGIHIAEELGVSRPTVCVALKALEKEGYLTMDESRAVYLTQQGECIAKQTYERNMTFLQLLIGLGVEKKIAAADACKMEHTVSSASYEAIKRLTERIVCMN